MVSAEISAGADEDNQAGRRPPLPRENARARHHCPRPATCNATPVVTVDVIDVVGTSFPEAHLDPAKMAALAPAASSPLINERFSLRFNQDIAEKMGGMAVHSCGVCDHTMKLLPGRGVMAVDCSVSPRCDPTPMTPKMVRAALGGTREEIERAIAIRAGPDMRLILVIARIDEDDAACARTAEANYTLAAECLARASGA